MWTCHLNGGPMDGETVEAFPARWLLLAMNDRGHYELQSPLGGPYNPGVKTYRWTEPGRRSIQQ